MREILFRGKSRSCKEWLYGYFCCTFADRPEIMLAEGLHIGKKFIVLSETVGEYTGLKDRNGKRIFEGDIVKLYNTFLTVTFDAGCFYAGGDSLRTFDNSLEVVGNIHDNPELLRRREMTLKEAIDLSLEVWRYLAEHPEIDNKADLPEELYGKIGDMLFFCPLCEYYRRFSYNGCGIGCALLIGKGLECCDKGHPYKKWKLARSRKTRREAATAIVKLLEAALEKENQNEKSN